MGLFEKSHSSNSHWSKKNNCKIYNIECVPIFGEELDILIFYKTNLELEMFKTKKITDLTKKEFIAILEEIGYTTEFNNNIRINFDSDENVQKNYQGTIIYMSLYTVVFRYCEK